MSVFFLVNRLRRPVLSGRTCPSMRLVDGVPRAHFSPLEHVWVTWQVHFPGVGPVSLRYVSRSRGCRPRAACLCSSSSLFRYFSWCGNQRVPRGMLHHRWRTWFDSSRCCLLGRFNTTPRTVRRVSLLVELWSFKRRKCYYLLVNEQSELYWYVQVLSLLWPADPVCQGSFEPVNSFCLAAVQTHF